MRAQHTAGPWKVLRPLGPGNIGILSEHVNAGGNFYVAELPNCPHNEAEANARLIAAAPDLLAALKDIMQDLFGRINHGVSMEHMQAADATIRKAKETTPC